MPIPCGLANTVKGKTDDTHHDHMRGLNSFANGWLEAMMGNGPGNIAFNHKFQKAVLADLSALEKIMPKVPKVMKFVESPHINLNFVTADMEEDDANLLAGIQALKGKVTEASHRLNPTPQTIPLTPVDSLPLSQIDPEENITHEKHQPFCNAIEAKSGEAQAIHLGIHKGRQTKYHATPTNYHRAFQSHIERLV